MRIDAGRAGEFIAEEQADPECDWSVAEMCRTLEVSRSGFYDWLDRAPSEREVTDRMLEMFKRRPEDRK